MYDRGNYGEVKKTNKVYASNLSYITTEEDLKTMFGEFGHVVEINLKRKEAITFAFIEFSQVEQAEAAIEALNRKSVNGLDLKCEFARGERKTFNNRGGYQNDRGYGGGYQRGGRSDGPRRDFGDRPRGCFNCGEEGHMIRECPKPRKPRDEEGGYRGGYRGGDRGGERGEDRGGRDYERKQERRRRSNSSDRSEDRQDRQKKNRRRRNSSSGSR